MRQATFRIGSTFDASKRQDPMFKDALDRIRNASRGQEPVVPPLRWGARHARSQTRLVEFSKVA